MSEQHDDYLTWLQELLIQFEVAGVEEDDAETAVIQYDRGRTPKEAFDAIMAERGIQ